MSIDHTEHHNTELPRWVKRALIAFAAVLVGAGGGAGVRDIAAAKYDSGVDAKALEALSTRQEETRGRVDALTDRIGMLEQQYAAQAHTINAAAETLRDLVMEVRANGKIIARMSGVMEEQAKQGAQ